jgi:hypothetical protein
VYYSCPGLRSLKKRRVQLEDLDNGQAVLVNYNFEEASERGFWYDAVVSGIKITSSAKSLACTISVGEWLGMLLRGNLSSTVRDYN